MLLSRVISVNLLVASFYKDEASRYLIAGDLNNDLML